MVAATVPASRASTPPVLIVGDRIQPADIAQLCRRLRALVEGFDARVVACQVGAVVHPDAGTVDAVARLQLTARRLGGEVRLCHVPDRLRGLLTVTGLLEVLPVLPVLPASGFEAGRQAEDREQVRGVEEVHDPGDLPV